MPVASTKGSITPNALSMSESQLENQCLDPLLLNKLWGNGFKNSTLQKAKTSRYREVLKYYLPKTQNPYTTFSVGLRFMPAFTR